MENNSDPAAPPASPDELAEAWHRILEELQPNQRAWLRTSEPVTLHESTAIVAVPNDFTRGQVEGRLRGQLEDALSDAFGREIRIAVTVNPALDDHSPGTAYDENLDQPTSPQDSLSTMGPPHGGRARRSSPSPRSPPDRPPGTPAVSTPTGCGR